MTCHSIIGRHFPKATFRERGGVRVRVRYDVRGVSGDPRYPYVNDLPTLKLAVRIGRFYPGIYHDGAATHIVRSRDILAPPGTDCHHSSKETHRWRVFADGRLELLERRDTASNWRPFWLSDGPLAFLERRDQPGRWPGIHGWIGALPPPPFDISNRAASLLETELADLAMIADRFGLNKAATHLRDLSRQVVIGRRTTVSDVNKHAR